MIIVKIQGGLGNQMFQYAFAKALSLKNNVDFALNVFDYKTYFRPLELEVLMTEKKYATLQEIPFYERLNSKNRYISFIFFKIKEFCKRTNKDHFFEKTFAYDKDLLSISSGYIEGYFQTEKYFIAYQDEIRKSFEFKHHPSKQNQHIVDIITNQNSVSIHIRRGDYLHGKNLSYHGICRLDYYKDAIAFIISRVESPSFFFFSDDMDWVKKNFKNIENSYYVDRNTGKDSYEDMRLMSLCKHNIVANSSFSWWGAWLNKNKNKIIIAPKRWFNQENMDIIPEQRIKI